MNLLNIFGFHSVAQEVQQQEEVQEGVFGENKVIVTTDPAHPGLQEEQPNMQRMAYLVLSEEEIDKGYVRPFRREYRHVVCGKVTGMGQTISETFARQPDFYKETFCFHCKKHFDLVKENEYQFFWQDGTPVGQ